MNLFRRLTTSRPSNAAAHVLLALERCCRRCGCERVLRCQTRWFERWLKHFSVARPHRCNACDWRGWI